MKRSRWMLSGKVKFEFLIFLASKTLLWENFVSKNWESLICASVKSQLSIPIRIKLDATISAFRKDVTYKSILSKCVSEISVFFKFVCLIRPDLNSTDLNWALLNNDSLITT